MKALDTLLLRGLISAPTDTTLSAGHGRPRSGTGMYAVSAFARGLCVTVLTCEGDEQQRWWLNGKLVSKTS